MAKLQYEGVGITAMAGCVPKHVIKNLEYTQYFPKEDVAKLVEKIGIYERRFADAHTCSSDLCYHAAERLLENNSIDRSQIDVLLFITQTPDYRMPSNSLLLHDRLHLSHNTIAFDITLGCSGFLYGLSVAYSLLAQSTINKVLILDGETRSKVYNPKDRKTAFLFGDGGVAVLVEKNALFGKTYFSLNSDGSMANTIKIDAGGYRNPSSEESLKERVVDDYGNIRTDENGYMDGETVFNFVASKIPKDVRQLCDYANVELNTLDYYVFHQANNFMNQHIVKRLKIDRNKVPTSIAKYGNTSSVSVPLTIVSELKDQLNGNHRLLLSAFGVGLTWGTAIVPFLDCKISEIVEI